MEPVVLRTDRLVLDQPRIGDHARIVEYCQDPLFEHYMTIPWPYEPKHADYFLLQHVPNGWQNDSEFTWALRYAPTGGLLGVVGYRAASGDIGFWLGAPHRGLGLMTEAVIGVTEWLFGRGVPSVAWECVVGNGASASVARKAGFTFTGERVSALADRDGGHPLAWHGVLLAADGRDVKPGWPGVAA